MKYLVSIFFALALMMSLALIVFAAVNSPEQSNTGDYGIIIPLLIISLVARIVAALINIKALLDHSSDANRLADGWDAMGSFHYNNEGVLI